jgi:hypothetical protein
VKLSKHTALGLAIFVSLGVLWGVLYPQFKEYLSHRNEIQVAREPSDVVGAPEKISSEKLPSKIALCEDFYSTICKSNEIVTDPTGSVQPDIRGEVEALRLYETILHQHPDWTNEQVEEELVSRIYTPRRKKMLLDTYQWIQKRMIRLFEKESQFVVSSENKKEIIQRLQNISLEVPPPVSLYANERDLFTKNDVYYETLSENRRIIRVGGAYLLSAKSWFNRVFTIAHEMAHAIDPCELELSNIWVVGYQKLTTCFSDEKVLSASEIREGCGKSNLIGEAFSDWLATQITVQALEMYSNRFRGKEELYNSVINSVKDLCNQEGWLVASSDSHPNPKIRIEQIFGTHPGLLALLGCPTKMNKVNTCTLEGKR